MRQKAGAIILLIGFIGSAEAKEKPARQAEAPTTVVGVRGLEKNKVSTDTKARDYSAIDRLEAVKVTPEELQKFKKEGDLK